MKDELTHVDESGSARMVDVGGKAVSRRTAVARARCRMQADTANAIRDNALKKGDVLQVARIAAISAAKRTDELIPLCHTVPIDKIDVDFQWQGDELLEVRCTATATGKTGVEMEALVAASLAALTVYDMCKAMDRTLSVEEVVLLHKTGGKHGDFSREETSL